MPRGLRLVVRASGFKEDENYGQYLEVKGSKPDIIENYDILDINQAEKDLLLE